MCSFNDQAQWQKTEEQETVYVPWNTVESFQRGRLREGGQYGLQQSKIEKLIWCMIISENTVLYAPHFTVYHTHQHTLTWKHQDAPQCDLFVLLVQWTEAVAVVTVWW